MAGVANLILGSWPNGPLQSSISLTNLVMSATTTKLGFCFQSRSAAAITALGFRYGVATGTPPTYKISLQGVDGSGNPDGTIKGGGSPASATFTPPATTAWNSTWQWITLSNTYTPAVGDLLSIVIEYSSGTVNASNSSSIAEGDSDSGWGPRIMMPYALTNTGSWSKVVNLYPLYGYQDASNSYGFPLQNYTTTGTQVTVDGNRAAMRFTLPSGAGTSIGVAGIRCCISPAASGGTQTHKFGVWDGSGNVIASVSLDVDYASILGSVLRGAEAWFPTPGTLNDGTVYYAGIERNGATFALNTLDFANAGDLSAIEGGSGLRLSTWNGSAWADTTTSRPMVELILSDMTASGGGGMLVHPGMVGGMRG